MREEHAVVNVVLAVLLAVCAVALVLAWLRPPPVEVPAPEPQPIVRLRFAPMNPDTLGFVPVGIVPADSAPDRRWPTDTASVWILPR